MGKATVEEYISKEKIQQRVRELGQQISDEFAGQEVTIVCLLRGSFVFCADLVREISIPLQVEFMTLSSYGNATQSSGSVRIIQDLEADIKDKNVIIVEDIVDTGLTIKTLLELLHVRQPKAMKLVSLLFKPSKLEHAITPDYIGFEIEDKFVIGYGLDYAQYYRNLPYVGIMKND